MGEKDSNNNQDYSNVNIYFVPNHNAPEHGGKFYNVYKSEENVVLNLDGLNKEQVEQIVKEKTEEGFLKKVGGIILKRDQTIGNISAYSPDDGKYSISQEQKRRNQEIEDLSKEFVTIMQKSEEETRKLQEQLLEIQKQIMANQIKKESRLTEIQKRLNELLAEKEEIVVNDKDKEGEER